MIFSFTLWNNCLSIACSITSSSPEKRAILYQNQTLTSITPALSKSRALRTRNPTQPPALLSAVPPEDRGQRLEVCARLPARGPGKQVTLLWESRGPDPLGTTSLVAFSSNSALTGPDRSRKALAVAGRWDVSAARTSAR